MDYFANTPSSSGHLKATKNANTKNDPRGKWQPHVAFYKWEKEELSEPVTADQLLRLISIISHTTKELSMPNPFPNHGGNSHTHVSALLICRHWHLSCDALQLWSLFPTILLVLIACFLFWCFFVRLCPVCPNSQVDSMIPMTCSSNLMRKQHSVTLPAQTSPKTVTPVSCPHCRTNPSYMSITAWPLVLSSHLWTVELNYTIS